MEAVINVPMDLFAALQKTGDEVEITESLYWHFLEVLPPRNMGPGFFIFQEGDGARLYFSELGKQHYCYLLSDFLVTDDWKIHAQVSRNNVSEPFKLMFAFANDDTCEVPNELQDLIGMEYGSVSALAAQMGVNFRV